MMRLLPFLFFTCAGSFVPSVPAADFALRGRTTHRGRSRRSLGGAEALPELDALPQTAVHEGQRLLAGSSPYLLANAGASETYLATGLFGVAAAAIIVGAGALVYSTVSGKDGLGAFLGKEKANNPFYQDTMAKVTPKTPDILNKIRLPELDFVEVYNQPAAVEDYADERNADSAASGGNQDSGAVATAEGLRQRLLEAVQAKDYDLASTLERELAAFLRENGLNFDDRK